MKHANEQKLCGKLFQTLYRLLTPGIYPCSVETELNSYELDYYGKLNEKDYNNNTTSNTNHDTLPKPEWPC